jgi:c-di-GMP-binding flagellar brake protein YcgR
MDVEHSSGRPESTVYLRMAGAWQPEDERRHQARVPVQIRPNRARRWVGGAWRDLDAMLVDLSSRGIGLSVDHQVKLGDRLSLVVPLGDGQPDLRVTVEVRHVQSDRKTPDRWRAGGVFRNLAPVDHERVIRFIFAELRGRP